jgi:DNA ligase (NAD+)
MSSVQELVNEIQKLSKEYYYEGDSRVPDEYFDKLVKDLTKIDPDNIILRQVNYGVGSSRDKKSHKYQILGLPKKYEVVSHTGLTTMTPKLDGISVVVYYEKGILVNVLTRGDGFKGIDITSKVLNHVPSKLQIIPSDHHISTTEFALRGELIIKNSTFREYLSTSYKNPRNCVAGLANAIDSDLSLADIIFYDMYTDTAGLVPQREFNITKFSEDINKVIMIESDHVSNELLKLQYSSYKNLYDYTLDGVVVESSGEKYAFKENSLGISSRVIGIEWNSSGYGKLVPVILIEPADVSGVTISRVSGNSYNYLLKNMIMIGSYVKVIRSGEVIPYITEVTNYESFNISNLGINFNYYEKGSHIYEKINEYNEFHYSLVRLINRAKIKGIGDKLSNQFADMIIEPC